MYKKDELQQIAKEQEFVYVVDEDTLDVYKYPTKDIDFVSSWRRALIDIPAGEITVCKTIEEAWGFVKHNILYKIEQATEEIEYQTSYINEMVNLHRTVELKDIIENWVKDRK